MKTGDADLTISNCSEQSKLHGLIGLAAASAVSVLLVSQTQPEVFQPYFGNWSPAVSICAIAVVGIFALYQLERRWAFCVYRPASSLRGLAVAAGCAIPFMIVVTVADLLWGFPADMNVRLPMAVLFYPAMGFAAQVTMHIVPFLIFLSVGRLLFGRVSRDHLIAVCILLVAGLEATFQVVAGSANTLLALDVFVAAHLFLFGLVELYIFWKFDFWSMYAFRVVYYLYWHGVWAQMRLI